MKISELIKQELEKLKPLFQGEIELFSKIKGRSKMAKKSMGVTKPTSNTITNHISNNSNVWSHIVNPYGPYVVGTGSTTSGSSTSTAIGYGSTAVGTNTIAIGGGSYASSGYASVQETDQFYLVFKFRDDVACAEALLKYKQLSEVVLSTSLFYKFSISHNSININFTKYQPTLNSFVSHMFEIFNTRPEMLNIELHSVFVQEALATYELTKLTSFSPTGDVTFISFEMEKKVN